jgi:hypothetical protein
MSKIVKKVFRGVKKVVKGIGKAVKKVWKAVTKNPILRTIAFAGLMYFGGAALLGGLGGAAGGGGISGFISGAGQGITNAWAGVTGAASSVASGNFAQAGAQLSAGAKGTVLGGAPGQATTVAGTTIPGSTDFVGQAAQSTANANQALANAGQSGVGAAQSASQGQGLLGGKALFNPAEAAVQAGANQGVASGVSNAVAANTANAGSGFLSNPLVQYGALQTGGQMLSGYAQGQAQESMYERQLAEEQSALERYQQNMGSYIPRVVWNPETGRYETEVTSSQPQNQELMG